MDAATIHREPHCARAVGARSHSYASLDRRSAAIGSPSQTYGPVAWRSIERRVQVARLAMSIYVNGHDPYRFLVNMGALPSVLATEIAARLALPLCPPVLLQRILLVQKTAEVNVDRLSVRSVICTNLRFPALPSAVLETDGYLGLDVLNGHRVVFDFGATAPCIQ